MANVETTLQAISPSAERALFGLPTWTAIASESNATVTASKAALATFQHCLTHLSLSFSAPTTNVLTLQVSDGATVIWQVQIATGFLTYTENFETRPLHASSGVALTATVAAAGAGITQTIALCGFSVRQP